MPTVSTDRRLPENIRSQTGPGTDVQSKDGKGSYYDISLLQAPVWEGPLIGSYFFLGGLSGGAYLLARMGEIFGGRSFREMSRAGSTIAALATLPCAPLLIADLGDPSRFHHMLRVFKPRSPMNLGTWVVTAYSSAAAGAALREWMHKFRGGPRSPVSKVADKSLAVVTDAAGVPLALLMICYTGVLLSGTATPVWTKNKWLAPLFAASAIGNGAAAISLALQWANRHKGESDAERALDKVETAAHVLETAVLAQYLRSLGPLKKPLTQGTQAKYIIAATAARAASEVLKYAPLQGRKRCWGKAASALLSIGSGLVLKYGIVEAGKPSASDPRSARLATSKQRNLVR